MASQKLIVRLTGSHRDRIPVGGSLKINCQAWAKWGVQHATFTITPASGTYDGQASKVVNVSLMTLNSDALSATVKCGSKRPYPCFELTIQESLFSAQGPFNVAVSARNLLGQVRSDTRTHRFFVNKGTLKTADVYLNSVTGNDSTAVLGSTTLRARTINRACEMLRAEAVVQGNAVDLGGFRMLLAPGTYPSTCTGSNAQLPSQDEFVTIMGDGTGTPQNTVIEAPPPDTTTPPATYLANIESNFLKVYGVTLKKWSGTTYYKRQKYIITRNAMSSMELRVENCVVWGGGRYPDEAPGTLPGQIGGPGTAGFDPQPIRDAQMSMSWYLDSDITQVGKVTTGGNRCYRNFKAYTNSSDFASNARVVVNAEISDGDPALYYNQRNGGAGNVSYWHCDGVQFAGAVQANVLIYGVRCTGWHYQGLFSRNSGTYDDVAIINCVFALRDVVPTGGGLGALWLGGGDHILFLHNTLLQPSGSGARTLTIRRDDETAQVLFRCNDLMFVGNVLQNLSINISEASTGNTVSTVMVTVGTPPVSVNRGQPGWYFNGNPYGNEWHHNHYISTPAVLPDTAGVSLGAPGIELNPDSPNYARPLSGTAAVVKPGLVSLVPVDIEGKVRNPTGATAGAYEFGGAFIVPTSMISFGATCALEAPTVNVYQQRRLVQCGETTALGLKQSRRH